MRDIVELSMASAAMSFLVSEAKIMRPVRERAGVLKPLLSCGYCMGHWFGLVLAIWFGCRVQGSILMGALLIAWMSAFQWAALRMIMEVSDGD